MGRKKNRKRERRAEQRGWQAPSAPAYVQDTSDIDDLILAFEDRRASLMAPPAPQCGMCREFVEDEHGGRGNCLHPGSGIVSPWTDTPGCPFFARRR